MTRRQRGWLTFCLMGLLLTNQVCWSGFERCGLGAYRFSALSWMFRHTKILWEVLWQASVGLVLEQYGLGEGVLVVDDSDQRRAKRTKRIYRAHKLYDKKTGGYFNGQALVFLVLVTPRVTVPVGFRFACPDPKQVAWRQEDARLKRQQIPKAQRPARPASDPAYLSKLQLALALIERFRHLHPQLRIKAVLADALYATHAFMDQSAGVCNGAQTVSQLRSNQKIRFRGRERTLTAFFAAYPGVAQRIQVRGGPAITVSVSSARGHVCAHGQKRFVIALSYPGETQARDLVATDLSWRTLDIVQVYTLRWLVEVFLEDWKLNEGWGQLAKQPDEEGSSRSLTLSLLLDHALLLHPEQRTRLNHQAPACTVGSLRQHCQGEALMDMFRRLLAAEDPTAQFAQRQETIKTLFPLAPSTKHMSGRDRGRQEPTPALRYRAAEVCACA
ncbi:transposase [Thiocystis violacea]|uniref:transposase n=1 Tax=Thiocystis violacea TaxID=13725 RepID=UPI001F5B3F5E|nr:transposase [Thiocystis violacea]